MPQIEALYVVEFGDIAGGPNYWNGGVAVLETNRIFGGDSGYYYVGTFLVNANQVEAVLKVTKHNPTWHDAFGTTAPSFNIKIQGTIGNGVIQGQMERNGIRLPIRLTSKENLP